MAQHAQLRIDTGLDIYFCDPQSPWQRGTNENTNGSFANTSPKAPTSPDTLATTSTPSLTRSTPDPAKPSTGKPPPRPSTNYYTPPNKTVLQPPVESTLGAFVGVEDDSGDVAAAHGCGHVERGAGQSAVG